MIKKINLDKLFNFINTLIISKNQDYGDSFFLTRQKFGEISFLIRLTDKFNRLNNLLLKPNSSQYSEKIEDTIIDIIGYCILELYYRKYYIKQINNDEK